MNLELKQALIGLGFYIVMALSFLLMAYRMMPKPDPERKTAKM